MIGGMLGGAGGMGPGGGGGGLLGGLGLDMGLYNMPIIGSFFQNPNEIHQQQQMQAMGQTYGQYRPEMAQAQMNAMNGSMQAMSPYNNAMAMMYGPGFQQSPQIQNPMSDRMMGMGNPAMPGQQVPQGGEGSGGPMGMLGGLGGGMMGGGSPLGMLGGLF